jgi:hypothetical protein
MRIISFLLALLVTTTAVAQETPVTPGEFQLPEPSEILPLRRGTAAPHDGLLIDAGDMLRIQQEYDRMRYLLTRTSERDAERCEVQVAMEHAHVSACEERVVLRDTLWTARQAELVAQVMEARAQAQRAAERAWYESPVIWFIVGVVATAAVWIAVSVR